MSRAAFLDALDRQAPEFDLALGDEVRVRFAAHFDLLVRWNRRLNLTRIVDPSEAARFHFLESAYLSRLIVEEPAALVDVGSGAGFPGLPLACIWSRVPVELVEPNRRRAVFLKEVVRALGLGSVRVRAERFDSSLVHSDTLLVARALDRFDALLEPLLTSPAGRVALFSEPDLLERGARLAPNRSFRSVFLPGAERRAIGLYEACVPRETRPSRGLS